MMRLHGVRSRSRLADTLYILDVKGVTCHLNSQTRHFSSKNQVATRISLSIFVGGISKNIFVRVWISFKSFLQKMLQLPSFRSVDSEASNRETLTNLVIEGVTNPKDP